MAGVHERQDIRVKTAVPPPTKPLQIGVLGRLGRMFGSPTKNAAIPAGEVGTLGTGQYTYRENKKSEIHIHICSKEFQTPVPSVPVEQVRLDFETPVPGVPSPMNEGVQEPPTTAGERLPFLTAGGTLSIPFDSPPRYHWWRSGQSVAATMAESSAKQISNQG
jgi:hypothetical protein